MSKRGESNWQKYKEIGCDWKNGLYVIPNYKDVESIASRFSTLEELQKWYPDPSSTVDNEEIQRVKKQRLEDIVHGVVGKRRNNTMKDKRVNDCKSSRRVPKKTGAKPAPLPELCIGDAVLASYKKSKGKYPGVIVKVGSDTYSVQFDDGDFDERVPKRK